MRQLSDTLVTAFCVALFAGMTLGYVSEAGARDRGGASRSTVEARGFERSGGRVDRRRGYEERVFGGESAIGAFSGGGIDAVGRSRDRREARRADVRRSAGSRLERRRGWRDMDAAKNRYVARGSFIRAFAAPDDAGSFIEYHGGHDHGVVILDPSAYGAEASDFPLPSYSSEPRFIDIETERLDRRPVGPSGIEVIYAGGAKIIRITPDYSRKASLSDGGREVSAPTLGNEPQPWSAGWLKYCARTHKSFDPELGTYVERDGRVRFCERSR